METTLAAIRKVIQLSGFGLSWSTEKLYLCYLKEGNKFIQMPYARISVQ